MATATTRTVFVIGKAAEGNREMLIVESGDTYSLTYAAISTYNHADATFDTKDQ